MYTQLTAEQIKLLEGAFERTKAPTDDTLRALLAGKLNRLTEDLVRDRLMEDAALTSRFEAIAAEQPLTSIAEQVQETLTQVASAFSRVLERLAYPVPTSSLASGGINAVELGSDLVPNSAVGLSFLSEMGLVSVKQFTRATNGQLWMQILVQSSKDLEVLQGGIVIQDVEVEKLRDGQWLTFPVEAGKEYFIDECA